MPSKLPKQLFISTSPVPGSTWTEVELTYGGFEIGAVTLTPEIFADFIEGLRAGFTVVAEQRTKDVREFGRDLPDVDEEDD